MQADALRATIFEIAGQLARGEYGALVQQCARSRLTSEDMRNVIHDYGRKLVCPPGNAYDDLDAVPVKNAALPTWSVRAPMWTEEEGRSDLTLDLTITVGSDKPVVEFDDLHVL
jgi:hypothetical protein